MKPYLYILFVLLVGGGIGYYIGIKTTEYELKPLQSNIQSSNDQQAVLSLLDRQKEAYNLHDELMLLRDCADNYVEINGMTGDVFGLQKAVLYYHDQFRPGKNINFGLNNPEIKISGATAVIRSNYFKTSDSYENMGIKGFSGEGTWMLSKSNGIWKICAFNYLETAKR
jgi:hypothetical protein